MSYISRYVGALLKARRGDRSQKAVAKAAGLNPAQYGRYERGEAAPGDDVLEKIASALGCDVDSLLGDLGSGQNRRALDEHQRRAVRLRGGKSSEEVAAAAGISTSELDRYEKGVSVPTLDVMGRLARALDVTTGDVADALSRSFFHIYRWTTADKNQLDQASITETIDAWKYFTGFADDMFNKISILLEASENMEAKILNLEAENELLKKRLGLDRGDKDRE